MKSSKKIKNHPWVLKVKRRHAWWAAGGLALLGTLALLFVLNRAAPPHQQPEAIAPSWRVLHAGHALGPVPLGSVEGLKPREVIVYGPPTDVRPYEIFLTGSWRSDPDGLTHVGSDPGVVFVGFSGSSVQMVAGPGQTPSVVAIFFDGVYVDLERSGRDVQRQNGIPALFVDRNATYDVVSNVPEGLHLVGLATKSNGFTVREVRYG